MLPIYIWALCMYKHKPNKTRVKMVEQSLFLIIYNPSALYKQNSRQKDAIISILEYIIVTFSFTEVEVAKFDLAVKYSCSAQGIHLNKI